MCKPPNSRCLKMRGEKKTCPASPQVLPNVEQVQVKTKAIPFQGNRHMNKKRDVGSRSPTQSPGAYKCTLAGQSSPIPIQWSSPIKYRVESPSLGAGVPNLYSPEGKFVQAPTPCFLPMPPKEWVAKDEALAGVTDKLKTMLKIQA